MIGIEDFNVSRETIEKLRAYEALVKRWTTKINLISKSTVEDIWDRHILDSVQLFYLAPDFKNWIDLGSGGGFPGIVVAILAEKMKGSSFVTLIESDQRKAVFLRSAARELDIDAVVLSQRIESVEPQSGDIVSARALTEVKTLLTYAQRHLAPDGTALLMKGAKWKDECDEARKVWTFDCEPHGSKTDPNAAILKIKDIARV